MTTLFDSLKMSELVLANRILMAPFYSGGPSGYVDYPTLAALTEA